MRPPAASADVCCDEGALSELLLDAVRQLAFARDLETVMQVARTAARQLTGADGVTFVLREGQQCHYADEEAIAPLWKGRRFALSACISGWAMLHGEPVAVEDVFADPRIPHDAYRATFVKSLVVVPVRTPDPVAAIGAYWAAPHAATRSEVRRLQAIADSAALAMANVQLYADLQTAIDGERQARRAAEATAAAKDNFLAEVSHELRQPLSAASAAVALLKAQRDPATTQVARAVVERQIGRMTRLVDDLLESARILRHEARLQIARVDLRDIAQRAVESATPAVAERHHVLRLALPDAPCWVVADAGRLEQVVTNLLTNAAKYTPDGGRIDVSLTAGTDTLRLSVRDTGEGIDRTKLRRIFQLFTRVSESDERGFGIGLAVSQRLVEQHGGSLTARSDGAGQGSEFIVELPHGEGRARRQA